MLPRVLPLLFALPLLPGCEPDTGPEPVALLEVAPSDTVLATGDTLRLRAIALGLAGEPLDVPLAYHTTADALSVDEQGRVVGRADGVGTVEVREPGGVRGEARIVVSRVTGVTPNHAAFGGVVTIGGSGFDAASTVRFGAVPGEVRSVSDDGRRLEAWVPYGAQTAPVQVRTATGAVAATPDTFYLTGDGDDALEPNDFDRATPVPVPYRNPFLLSRATNLDHVEFTLEEATPLTVRVHDREPPDGFERRLVLQVNRADDDFGEYVGIAPGYDVLHDEQQDAVVGRLHLGPGRYSARIFVQPGFAVPDRRYALTIDTVATYEIDPDGYEPNDFPDEAAAVDVPFLDTLRLENPWTADYFDVTLTERTQVAIRARSFFGGMGVFLYRDHRSVTWLLSSGVRPDTFVGSIAPFGLHQFGCVLDPGLYRVAVLDNSGGTGEYELELGAEPAQELNLTCQSPFGADPGAFLPTGR